MTTSLEDARKEMDAEFAQFRDKGLGRIHEAVDRVVTAGATSDVYGLLKRLEEVVEDVRTGGLLGAGAKGHSEAREEWLKVGGHEVSL